MAHEPAILPNDLKRQWADTGEAALAAVQRVGASGWYVLGSEVEAFEQSLARTTGRKHAVGCASGLDAIEIALRALEIPPGTKVLTTPLTAFATTLAILRAGGVPVFVDVDERGLIDLDLCRRALANDREIRAMVPVHLYGQPIDLDALSALRREFDLLLVEDGAQSIGARWGDRAVGDAGQLAALSFYPTKNLGALGDGGAVLTDDAALAERCRCLRDYGQSRKYVHEHLGLNSRLDELHAAILREALLPRLPAWTERRRSIARQYLEGIQHPSVELVRPAARSAGVWHLFPILVPADRRDSFTRHLEDNGVVTGIHYPRLVSAQPALVGQRCAVLSGLDRAAAFTAREVSLPIHPYLEDREVQDVIRSINDWPQA